MEKQVKNKTLIMMTQLAQWLYKQIFLKKLLVHTPVKHKLQEQTFAIT